MEGHARWRHDEGKTGERLLNPLAGNIKVAFVQECAAKCIAVFAGKEHDRPLPI